MYPSLEITLEWEEGGRSGSLQCYDGMTEYIADSPFDPGSELAALHPNVIDCQLVTITHLDTRRT